MKTLMAMIGSVALAASPVLADPQLTAHDYTKRMQALTEIQRYAALRAAVTESQLWCQRVMVAAYQGPYKNLDMWAVRCGPKPIVDYGAFVGPDGTVQVSSCADLIKVKWPACRKLP